MVIDESSRHALHSRLQEVLGDDHASVLMEHLPPVGWADVATKQDLALLRKDLEGKFEGLRGEFQGLRSDVAREIEASEARMTAHLHKELNSQTHTFVNWMLTTTIGSVVTVGALAFAAARLV